MKGNLYQQHYPRTSVWTDDSFPREQIQHFLWATNRILFICSCHHDHFLRQLLLLYPAVTTTLEPPSAELTFWHRRVFTTRAQWFSAVNHSYVWNIGANFLYCFLNALTMQYGKRFPKGFSSQNTHTARRLLFCWVKMDLSFFFNINNKTRGIQLCEALVVWLVWGFFKEEKIKA